MGIVHGTQEYVCRRQKYFIIISAHWTYRRRGKGTACRNVHCIRHLIGIICWHYFLIVRGGIWDSGKLCNLPKDTEEIGARFDPRLWFSSLYDFRDAYLWKSENARDKDQGLGQRKKKFSGWHLLNSLWPQIQFFSQNLLLLTLHSYICTISAQS